MCGVQVNPFNSICMQLLQFFVHTHTERGLSTWSFENRNFILPIYFEVSVQSAHLLAYNRCTCTLKYMYRGLLLNIVLKYCKAIFSFLTWEVRLGKYGRNVIILDFQHILHLKVHFRHVFSCYLNANILCMSCKWDLLFGWTTKVWGKKETITFSNKNSKIKKNRPETCLL